MAISSDRARRLPALAPVALAAALLAACTVEREPDVTPFAIAADVNGVPLAASGDFVGIAAVEAPNTLRLTSGESVLTVTFDADAAPGVAFPADLDGQQIGVGIHVDDAHVGADGAPLRIPGLQIVALAAGGGVEFRFLMGEGTYRTGNDLPATPPALRPINPTDFPVLQVIADNLYFEPAACGLVYYDRLRVLVNEREDLPFDTEKRVELGDPPAGWTVHHVLSWHRNGDCPNEIATWTQVAMWRS